MGSVSGSYPPYDEANYTGPGYYSDANGNTNYYSTPPGAGGSSSTVGAPIAPPAPAPATGASGGSSFGGGAGSTTRRPTGAVQFFDAPPATGAVDEFGWAFGPQSTPWFQGAGYYEQLPGVWSGPDFSPGGYSFIAPAYAQQVLTPEQAGAIGTRDTPFTQGFYAPGGTQQTWVAGADGEGVYQTDPNALLPIPALDFGNLWAGSIGVGSSGHGINNPILFGATADDFAYLNEKYAPQINQLLMQQAQAGDTGFYGIQPMQRADLWHIGQGGNILQATDPVGLVEMFAQIGALGDPAVQRYLQSMEQTFITAGEHEKAYQAAEDRRARNGQIIASLMMMGGGMLGSAASAGQLGATAASSLAPSSMALATQAGEMAAMMASQGFSQAAIASAVAANFGPAAAASLGMGLPDKLATEGVFTGTVPGYDTGLTANLTPGQDFTLGGLTDMIANPNFGQYGLYAPTPGDMAGDLGGYSPEQVAQTTGDQSLLDRVTQSVTDRFTNMSMNDVMKLVNKIEEYSMAANVDGSAAAAFGEEQRQRLLAALYDPNSYAAAELLGLDPVEISNLGFDPGSPEYYQYLMQQADEIIQRSMSGLNIDGDAAEYAKAFRGKTADELLQLKRALVVRGQLNTQMAQGGNFFDPFSQGRYEVGATAYDPATAAYQEGLRQQLEGLSGQNRMGFGQGLEDFLGRNVDIYGMRAGRLAQTMRERLAEMQDDEDKRKRLGGTGMLGQSAGDLWRTEFDQLSDPALQQLMANLGGDDDDLRAALAQIFGMEG